MLSEVTGRCFKWCPRLLAVVMNFTQERILAIRHKKRLLLLIVIGWFSTAVISAFRSSLFRWPITAEHSAL